MSWESENQLSVLFQDSHLVAIDKPAGLLVHRSRIDVHATEFALQKLRDQIGQPVFPVHRLDRPTSGVLLFALNQEMARNLGQQFEDRSIEKTYLAIVRGHPALSGRWDEPLLEKRDPMTDRKANKNKLSQPAVTEFETLKNWTIPFSTGKYPNSRYSLMKIRPLTGRKHQIRRHFNHMAYPIVGDTTHGDRRHNHLFQQQFGIKRLLLVAKTLKFIHPASLAQRTIVASTGREFNQAIEVLDSATLE